MNQLIENFGALGRRRLALMGGTAIVAVTALFFGLSAATAPDYRAIATDLNASEASQMMSALQAGGFEPRVSDDGTMVSVPSTELGRSRMALAEAGLPSADKAGWEIFRESSGIGMNSFMQRVNKMVAMEGALERSIQSMASVASARVHLAPGERETFSQERSEPRASVMITPRRGMQFTRSQAQAVRNLVAGGVPDIAADNIIVLTADGETILGSESDSSADTAMVGARVAIEERVARSIESILTAHVGAGNVRVKVAAEINRDREVIVQESFDPDQQVARSTSALAEQSQGRDGGNGAVDVANNLPGVENGAGAGGGREESRSKTLDEIVYESGSTRTEKVVEPGSIKRLTVAVVVNGRMEGDEYADRTPEEIERLTALVRGAAGIDPSRGDEVAVDSLRFAEAETDPVEVEAGGLSALLADHMGTLIRGGLFLVALAMFLLLAVRPALARRREAGAEAANVEPQAAASTIAAGALEQPPVETDAVAQAAGNASEEAENSGDERYTSLAKVKGNVMQRYLDELAGIVGDNREESLRVLRNWIHQKV